MTRRAKGKQGWKGAPGQEPPLPDTQWFARLEVNEVALEVLPWPANAEAAAQGLNTLLTGLGSTVFGDGDHQYSMMLNRVSVQDEVLRVDVGGSPTFAFELVRRLGNHMRSDRGELAYAGYAIEVFLDGKRIHPAS